MVFEKAFKTKSNHELEVNVLDGPKASGDATIVAYHPYRYGMECRIDSEDEVYVYDRHIDPGPEYIRRCL